MVKLRVCGVIGILVAWWFLPQAEAWFNLAENWQKVYVAYVNDVDVRPTAADTAPEAGTVSGPLTVRVHTEHLSDPLVDCKMQYRAGASDWRDLQIAWTTDSGSVSGDYLTWLKFYLRMEEASGDRVDAHNSLAFTTYTGTIGSTTGKVDDCVDFVSADASYLTRQLASGYFPTAGFALSFWFNLDTIASNQALVYYYGASSTVWQVAYSQVSGKLVAITDGAVTLESSTAISASTWYHVAFLAYGSAARLYLNNVEEDSTVWSGSITADASSYCSIGAIGSGGAPSQCVDGKIDELAYFRDVTFTSQADRDNFVAWLYNSGSGLSYSDTVATAPDGATTLTGTVEFREEECAFGRDSLTDSEIAKGNSGLIRLYVTDSLYQNGSLADDPDEDGTVGTWQDQWVVSFTMHASNSKPGRADPDFTPHGAPDQP